MRKLKIQIGQRFGKLTVIKEAGQSKQGHYLWLCHCDCGNDAIATSSALTSGKKKSCGCLLKNPIPRENLVGKKYGRLTVMDRAKIPKKRRLYWRCKCDCGQIIIVAQESLKLGRTVSCGCKRKEAFKKVNNIDCVEDSKLGAWNTNKSYANSQTGIRGITRLPNGRYFAQLQFKKKKVLSKKINTLEDAIQAHKDAWNKYIKPYLKKHTSSVENR